MTTTSKSIRMGYCTDTFRVFSSPGCSEEIVLPRCTHYFSLADIFYVIDLYFILLLSQ